jgi:hypothetical protein
LSRPRRYIALRLHPGGSDLGDLLHLGREDAIGDQKHVRAEIGTFMPGADLNHDAWGHHGSDTGNGPDSDHHVVELKIEILGEGDAEQEGWSPRCR